MRINIDSELIFLDDEIKKDIKTLSEITGKTSAELITMACQKLIKEHQASITAYKQFRQQPANTIERQNILRKIDSLIFDSPVDVK